MSLRFRHILGGYPLIRVASLHIFTHMGEFQSQKLDALFGALADPTRRAILARLAISDARVTDLAAEFPISLNSTSKHIRILERAGLLQRTVTGRDHVLSLKAARMAEAAEWLDYYRRFWDQRPASLEAFLTKKRAALTERKRE